MIGIFDSGMGGLTVLADAIKMLPNENFVYYGDFQNAPYGIKTKAEVLLLSENICEILINEYNVNAIVIACNTATSAAIIDLRRKYDIPIIGMEPAVKPAIQASEGKKIVVMATEMTLKEKKFNQLINRFENKNVIKVPCSPLVERIETVDFDETALDYIINECIPSVDSIESIVLGCTHFVFIKEYLREKYKNKLRIFDGNIGTIKNLKNRLTENKINIKENNKQEIIIIGSGDQEKIDLSKKIFNRYCEGRVI